MSIEEHKSYIEAGIATIKELGLSTDDIRLESIVPIEDGYQIGYSIVVQRDLFGEEKRDVYLVDLDDGKNLVRFMRRSEL